ncbi:DUF692 domain-containing protein [Streptomyces collinus]|uniref:Uncharacterized protein (UPF0276 family) n=1 Tax=Streptomyces collinus TaxID=42684 RepID=A0AA89TK11_STRCU|nr:DUF692 domain-containing protein [Streptomyces collinus]MBB5814542.1 uncharacterized protein (UPF0276 family) [Streptomyces collinus]WMX67550.1 DUF692 domain-containing protein [Streptomyces collinus]
MERLGTGIGWRPEIADAVERMPGIDWVEAVAENVCPGHLPDSLRRLRERGVTVVPHGVSLGLGGADRPDAGRLTALAERAEALGSPLVTEHIAFVRAGGPLTASPHLEAGHLLPVPRTRDALDVLCENIRIAQDALPVPLAVENIAALIGWPGEEMTEGQFLYEVADRTGVRLLIDVANLHTNHVNRGEDPSKALAELPLEAIAYVHVAGGFERDGVWHDSHAHPVPRPVLDILTDLASRFSPPGVLLERDENFPAPAELEHELSTIRRALEAGAVERVKAELRAAAGTASGGRGDALFAAAGAARREAAGGVGGGHLVQTGAVRQEGARRVTGGAGSGTGASRPGNETGATRPGDETGAAGAIRPGDETGTAGATRPADETGAAGAIRPGDETGTAGATRGAFGRPHQEDVDGARQRLALAQAALLSALVAGTPVPEGFDRVRVGVQARALAAKRADVVAKVAPELPVILGDGYRTAFLGYAQAHPMTSGYRRDALSFAEHLLSAGRPGDTGARRELREWWLERSGPAPRSRRPAHRLALATRRVLSRR